MENKIKQYESSFFISFMSTISAVSVIILHANGSFWVFRSDFSWILNNVVESLFYFAVPVFFMLTGVTLIDYPTRYKTNIYLKKRFMKTGIPFLFWSLFACFLNFIEKPDVFCSGNFFVKVYNGIVNTEFVATYWFFIPLFCIYLSIPLFAMVCQVKKVLLFTYILIIGVPINILTPFLLKIVNSLLNFNLEWPFCFSVIGNYLFYPLLGYVLHNVNLKRKFRIIIYCCSLGGFFIHCFGTISFSLKNNALDIYFKGYDQMPCLMYSIGVFVFFKYFLVEKGSSRLFRFTSWFQKYTFPIYLLHMFFFKPITTILLYLNISETTQLYVLLMVVTVIPICVFVTFFLRRIPLIRFVLP